MITRAIMLSLATVLLWVVSSAASACQFPLPERFVDQMGHARYISIVRAVSSQVHDDGGIEGPVIVQVQLIESLRGKPHHVRTIRYNNGTCGGNRLDVGHYFLLMADSDAPDVGLEAASEAAMDLTWFGYLPPEAWTSVHKKRNEIPVMVKLRQAIAGKGKIPAREIAAELQYSQTMMNFNLMSR